MPTHVLLGSDDRSDRLRVTAWADVLRPSFTPAELVDADAIAAEHDRVVVCRVDDDDAVLAVAVSDHDPVTGICLLSYLATAPDTRGSGHGAAVLGTLRETWAERGIELVVAEVHDPRAWPTTPSEQPVARMRFYAREGCGLLRSPWVQPALAGGERVPGMLLLVVRGPQPGATIDRDRMRAWVRRYFTDTEGRMPTDGQYDALLERMANDDPTVLAMDRLEDVEPLAWPQDDAPA